MLVLELELAQVRGLEPVLVLGLEPVLEPLLALGLELSLELSLALEWVLLPILAQAQVFLLSLGHKLV